MKLNKVTIRITLIFLMSLLCVIALAQVKMITGKVSDANGNSNNGVTVVMQGIARC